MALRVASLDYLGTVAARLRKDAVTSKMDQRSINRILGEVNGRVRPPVPSHIWIPPGLKETHAILCFTELRQWWDSAAAEGSAGLPGRERRDWPVAIGEKLQTYYCDEKKKPWESQVVLMLLWCLRFHKFARKFYIAQWFRDTGTETEKAMKSQSQRDDDSSDGPHHARDVETTSEILQKAEARKKFLRSVIKTSASKFSSLRYKQQRFLPKQLC